MKMIYISLQVTKFYQNLIKRTTVSAHFCDIKLENIFSGCKTLFVYVIKTQLNEKTVFFNKKYMFCKLIKNSNNIFFFLKTFKL